ncbi:hypothetical protein [Agrococcus baldri]|uniref:Uncharacterized protein n=1 Tax=Agrococcus baldri TaxID=153730 RepID=A0AA87RC48_9MICO|nr:hypothetical protein [Agrococcus baldri]GEK79942.1 hypothetical protein ABA31_12930 [Agrococcus baldri]
MRYPNRFHENTDHPQPEGERPEGGHSQRAEHERWHGRHPHGHGRFHRGGHGAGHEHEGRGARCHERERLGTAHDHERHGHEEHGRPGRHPRGGARRRPTLERSIVKSARRIRRADLTPEQLHRRIAATVSHADYVTTLRTLRRIGMELRGASETSGR